MADKNAQKEPCGLYLLTPEKIDDLVRFIDTLDLVLATGVVTCLQLRLKSVDDSVIIETAKALLPICHKHEVPLLLNDRADIAAEVDADGVHLGQEDGDVASARTLLGHNKDIGVTCHSSLHLAFEAGEAGANYVAFGSFFPSVTKKNATPADKEILSTWDEVTDIACVAIGGITPDNCRELADSGAHFVAVSSAVWNHKDGPVAAVRVFEAALA
ncbi:thiamine phosphate synthase [Kordiimonas pumila]|uniref:Thiamine-phosphate synthase n=1 Tax=Kordiimonas pumila TaxID=2161677 RepID=A0ABV7D6U9_9PROT|nr:thiamine phosphate synthase [Kordiimonas pumila]